MIRSFSLFLIFLSACGEGMLDEAAAPSPGEDAGQATEGANAANRDGDSAIELLDPDRVVTFPLVQSKLEASCSSACHVGAHQFNINDASSVQRYFRGILSAVEPGGIMRPYDKEKDVPGESLAEILLLWERSDFAR